MAMRQFVVFLSLINLVAGLAPPQSDQGLMRREMSLDSTGKLQFEESFEAKVGGGDQCDKLFVHLDAGKKCEKPNHLIPEEHICLVAAKAANGTVKKNFMVHTEWQDNHPPGCYVEGDTYYYNPTGRNSSKTLTGEPICMTREFRKGKAKNGEGPKCDGKEYLNIMDEKACQYAATCLSTCKEAEFRVKKNEEDKYPPGCFIKQRGNSQKQLCVLFNRKQDPADPTNAAGGGTPICQHFSDAKNVPASLSETLSSKALDGNTVDDAGQSNPCSYLGCNSHKCEWVSGGRISRVSAGKSCSNAVVKGMGEDASSVKGGTSVKISTLKDCVDVVRKEQGGSCSGHFQLHKETMTCSCVPLGDNCEEQEDEQVCRFVVKA